MMVGIPAIYGDEWRMFSFFLLLYQHYSLHEPGIFHNDRTMVFIGEIIPFYGHKIQVSEIAYRFTQIKRCSQCSQVSVQNNLKRHLKLIHRRRSCKHIAFTCHYIAMMGGYANSPRFECYHRWLRTSHI